MADRVLTEMQKKFLAVLFEEAKGDAAKAKKLAGYSPNVATSQITDSLAEEISDMTTKFIAQSSAKAVYVMFDAMDEMSNPLGLKERMAAAKDMMDRAGFVKTEKVEVTAVEPVFILPAKRSKDD